MAQAAVSLFLSDYKVVLAGVCEAQNAADLFFKAAEKAKKDPFLEAGGRVGEVSQTACNEGKCCCLLCNFLENPSNATHLVTMTTGPSDWAASHAEVTRLLNEAISHYLKGNYTALAIAVTPLAFSSLDRAQTRPLLHVSSDLRRTVPLPPTCPRPSRSVPQRNRHRGGPLCLLHSLPSPARARCPLSLRRSHGRTGGGALASLSPP